MKLATLSNWRNHALAILSTAFLLNAAPSTAAAADVVTETLWRSYDITMQATTAQGALFSTGKTPTVVDFYESTNDGGIAKGALLPGYFAGVHPDTFNRAQQVWSNSGSWLYPYVGKSTVVRGSDAGETNTPAPTGVRDLQMHPPVSAHLIVAAFRVPQSGDYSVLDLAVRRVNNNPGETSRLRVFNNAGAQIANLQATGPNWVRGAASYTAGTLVAGSYIYFAVDGDGSFSWDATEVAFTVRAASSIPPPSCSLMPTPSSLTVGGSSNLTWTATNATALTINQGIGTVTPASGSRSISPTVTTTYTATVTGPAGVATCATTVAVNAASAETLWRSYDIAMQASVAQGTLLSSAGKSPTVVDFYESTNDGGIGKGSLLPKYTLGVHPDAFNKAQQIWSAGTGSWLYSYVGKSTVNRGSDTDETNTPAPNGVRDFQMHAPNSARLIVAAFRAPQSGTYSVVDLAVRRVDTNANQTSRLRVFNATGTQIANLQATGPAWVRGSASYSVGALTAGSYIYFAVDNDGAFAWDATEVAFTVRATSAAATTTPVVTTPVVTVPVVTTPVVTTPVVTTPVVVKTSPKITGTPKTSTKANESYSFVPSASDADGDKLTFSIANKPAWLTFSTATGALTGTPTDAQVGIYRNVTIQVGSGGEYDTLAAFDIEVVSVGAKGVTLSWTPPTQNADGTALSNLAGYKIKYGTQTGVYTKEIAIANPGIAAYMVEGLTAGTYYFVITAYNSKGVESTVSNESSKKL